MEDKQINEKIHEVMIAVKLNKVMGLKLAALAGKSGKLLLMRCYRGCDLNDKEPAMKRSKKRASQEEEAADGNAPRH